MSSVLLIPNFLSTNECASKRKYWEAFSVRNVWRFVFLLSDLLGFATTVVLHPLDLVKTRLQVNDTRGFNFVKNFFVVIKKTYKEEGLKAFYQGISPAILGSVVSWSIYFSFYENAKNRYKQQQHVSELNGFYNMISSLEAGIIGNLITCPIWFLKTRLQLQNRACMVSSFLLYFYKDAWICSL